NKVKPQSAGRGRPLSRWGSQSSGRRAAGNYGWVRRPPRCLPPPAFAPPASGSRRPISAASIRLPPPDFSRQDRVPAARLRPPSIRLPPPDFSRQDPPGRLTSAWHFQLPPPLSLAATPDRRSRRDTRRRHTPKARPGRTRGAGPTSPTGPAPDGGAASLPRKGGAARDKLNQVAEAVYQRMDQLYQGKMYFPGYFPNELRSIFRDQVHLIQNAIIESRIDCQRHCGIFQYETISCNNCTDSHVICFGYNCESSAQWETAVRGLLSYINNWHKQDTNMRTTPAFLISPSFTCLEPQHLANLTLENASECLTQH
uniref:Izumo sperm-egg fusion protein 4 n=1 Tax=Urocitellus parryii TaxID=9999 RepID=A0A8D2HU40_UROPR